MSKFPTSRSRNNARTCVYDECNGRSDLEEAARFIHTHAPEYFTVRSTAGSEEGEDEQEEEGYAATTSPQDEDQETQGSVAVAAPPLTDVTLARIVKRLSRGVVIRASNVGLCRDLVGCVTLRWGELVPEWASLGTTSNSATTANFASASGSASAAAADAASLQGFIPELVVDPRSRRLGIASQLLDLAKQRLRHKGITSVYAQVMPHFHREAVFMFLHSCGFREFCRHAGRVVHVAPTAMRRRLPGGGTSKSTAAGKVAGNADEDDERQEQIVAAGATPRAPRARSRSPSRRSAARARLTHRSKSPLGPGMTALDVYDPSLAAFGDDGVAERSNAKHLAQHIHFQPRGVGNGADDEGGEGCYGDEHHGDDYEDALEDYGCDGDDGGEYEHGGGSDNGQGPAGEWALGFEEEAAAAAERLMGLQMSASLSPSSSARRRKGRSPGRRGHPAHPTPRPHQVAFSMFGPVADQQQQQDGGGRESKSESRRRKLQHSMAALGLTTDASTRTSTGTSIHPHPDTVNSLSPRIPSSRKPSQPAQRSQSSQQFTETQQQQQTQQQQTQQQQQQDHAHRASSSSRAKHQMRPVNCLDEAQQVCVDRGIPANTMVQCRVDQAVAGTIARAHLDVAIVRLDAGTNENGGVAASRVCVNVVLPFAVVCPMIRITLDGDFVRGRSLPIFTDVLCCLFREGSSI